MLTELGMLNEAREPKKGIFREIIRQSTDLTTYTDKNIFTDHVRHARESISIELSIINNMKSQNRTNEMSSLSKKRIIHFLTRIIANLKELGLRDSGLIHEINDLLKEILSAIQHRDLIMQKKYSNKLEKLLLRFLSEEYSIQFTAFFDHLLKELENNLTIQDRLLRQFTHPLLILDMKRKKSEKEANNKLEENSVIGADLNNTEEIEESIISNLMTIGNDKYIIIDKFNDLLDKTKQSVRG